MSNERELPFLLLASVLPPQIDFFHLSGKQSTKLSENEAFQMCTGNGTQ